MVWVFLIITRHNPRVVAGVLFTPVKVIQQKFRESMSSLYYWYIQKDHWYIQKDHCRGLSGTWLVKNIVYTCAFLSAYTKMASGKHE
jgi:hypothetical protein